MVNAPGSAAAVAKEVGSVGDLSSSLAGKQPFDVIVEFVTAQRNLPARFDKAAARLAETGGLWIAWPKKSSGVETDLNENLIRDVGLAAGLVDNKVCAIDETWSGLRFVVRVKDRKGKGRA
jgi:hypothetical protein